MILTRDTYWSPYQTFAEFYQIVSKEEKVIIIIKKLYNWYSSFEIEFLKLVSFANCWTGLFRQQIEKQWCLITSKRQDNWVKKIDIQQLEIRIRSEIDQLIIINFLIYTCDISGIHFIRNFIYKLLKFG